MQTSVSQFQTSHLDSTCIPPVMAILSVVTPLYSMTFTITNPTHCHATHIICASVKTGYTPTKDIPVPLHLAY